MPYKDGKYVDNGSGKKETWSNVKAGVAQGAREFFKSPAKYTARAADDFGQANTFTSGGSGNSGQSSSGKDNGAANWGKSSN